MSDTPELKVVLSADDKGLFDGLNKASEGIKSLTGNIQSSISEYAAGAAAGVTFANMLEKVGEKAKEGITYILKSGNAINEWAEKFKGLRVTTNESLTSLNEMLTAIRRSGGDMGMLDSLMTGWTRSIKSNADALIAQGVASSKAALQGMTFREYLEKVYEVYARMKTQADANVFLMEALGKGAALAAPKLKELVENMKEGNDVMRRQGLMTQERIAMQDREEIVTGRLGDAWDKNRAKTGDAINKIKVKLEEMTADFMEANQAEETMIKLREAGLVRIKLIANDVRVDTLAMVEDARKLLTVWQAVGLAKNSGDNRNAGAQHRGDLSLADPEADKAAKEATEKAAKEAAAAAKKAATEKLQEIEKENAARVKGLADSTAYETKIYADAQKTRVDLVKETAKAESEASKAAFDQQKLNLEQSVADGIITHTQELAELKKIREQELQVDLAAVQKEIEVYQGDLVGWRNLQDQMVALKYKAMLEMGKIDNDVAKEQGKAWEQNTAQGGIFSYLNETRQAMQQWGSFTKAIMQGVEQSFANGIRGIMSGQMSLGQGLKSIWKGIMDTVIQALAQMAAKWIVAAIAAKLFAKASGQSAQEEAVAKQQAAAAGIFNAHAYIPFVGPAIAAGLIAFMNASLIANSVAAKGITANARGSLVTGPTLALIGEGGENEVVAPETAFKDWAGNLTANIIAQQRQATNYQALGANYAQQASQTGSFGAGYVDLRGAIIAGESAESARIISSLIHKHGSDYDKKHG